MKTLVRDFAIALSLANLCFYPVWARLLPGAYGHYYLKDPPTSSANAATMLAVLLFASILWIAFSFARRSGSARFLLLARLAFLALFLLAFNVIRFMYIREFSAVAPVNAAETMAGFSKLPFALILLGVFNPWRQKVIRYTATAAVILLPFAAVTLTQTAWSIVRSQMGVPLSEFQDKPTAPVFPADPRGRRVVWLLFDGLDQEVAFSHRPASVKLPNLDRFRSEAVYAPDAHSPAGSTLLSIPALLTGRPIDQARPVGADDLRIRFSDTGRQADWSDQPTVFSRARDLGLNTALVGYHHPYGRILAKDLTVCVWAADRWDTIGLDDPALSLPKAALRSLTALGATFYSSLPFVWRLEGFDKLSFLNQQRPISVRLAEHIQNHEIILKEAKRVSAGPAFQLVFVHFPVPHQPYIWDQTRDEFSRDKETSYYDNLVLADRALGEVRSSMEDAGVWDESIVLITADHGYRKKGPIATLGRSDVPFLLKLPHQRQEILCRTSFHTLLIPDLILALLEDEEMRHPRSVVDWIERNPWKRPTSLRWAAAE